MISAILVSLTMAFPEKYRSVTVGSKAKYLAQGKEAVFFQVELTLLSEEDGTVMLSIGNQIAPLALRDKAARTYEQACPFKYVNGDEFSINFTEPVGVDDCLIQMREAVPPITEIMKFRREPDNSMIKSNLIWDLELLPFTDESSPLVLEYPLIPGVDRQTEDEDDEDEDDEQ
jgi:hypothetical protein